MCPTKANVWDSAANGEQSERKSELGSKSCSGFAVCWGNLRDFIAFLEIELLMFSLSSTQPFIISAIQKMPLIYHTYMIIRIIQMTAGSIAPTHISPKPFTLKNFPKGCLYAAPKSYLEKLYAHLPSRGDNILVKGLTPNAPCFQSSWSLKVPGSAICHWEAQTTLLCTVI